MFDQSYQQLYLQKQIIALGASYPCPRCKCGSLEAFGETETFICGACRRNFVAINAGRILYPAYSMKTKVAPVFWWDGLRWHLAGTTASKKQIIFASTSFLLPLAIINTFILSLNHVQSAVLAHTLSQNFYLNLAFLNVLVGFFMSQLLYFMCWEQDKRIKSTARQSTQYRH